MAYREPVRPEKVKRRLGYVADAASSFPPRAPTALTSGSGPTQALPLWERRSGEDADADELLGVPTPPGVAAPSLAPRPGVPSASAASVVLASAGLAARAGADASARLRQESEAFSTALHAWTTQQLVAGPPGSFALGVPAPPVTASAASGSAAPTATAASASGGGGAGGKARGKGRAKHAQAQGSHADAESAVPLPSESPWAPGDEADDLMDTMLRVSLRCLALTELIVSADDPSEAGGPGAAAVVAAAMPSAAPAEMSRAAAVLRRCANAALAAHAKARVAQVYSFKGLWKQALDHAAAGLKLLDNAREAAARAAAATATASGSASATGDDGGRRGGTANSDGPVPAEIIDMADAAVPWHVGDFARPTPLDEVFRVFRRAQRPPPSAQKGEGEDGNGGGGSGVRASGAAGTKPPPKLALATVKGFLDALAVIQADALDRAEAAGDTQAPGYLHRHGGVPEAWEDALRESLSPLLRSRGAAGRAEGDGDGDGRRGASGAAGLTGPDRVTWSFLVMVLRNAWHMEPVHADLCRALSPDVLAACLRLFRSADKLQVGFAPAKAVIDVIRRDVEFAGMVNAVGVVRDLTERLEAMTGADLIRALGAGGDAASTTTSSTTTTGSGAGAGAGAGGAHHGTASEVSLASSAANDPAVADAAVAAASERQPFFCWEEVAIIVCRHQHPAATARHLLRGRLLRIVGEAQVRLGRLPAARYALESALVSLERAGALKTYSVCSLFGALAALAAAEEAAVPGSSDTLLKKAVDEWMESAEAKLKCQKLRGLDPESILMRRAEARASSLRKAGVSGGEPVTLPVAPVFMSDIQARTQLRAAKVAELQRKDARRRAQEMATWREVQQDWMIKLWEVAEAQFGRDHLVTAHAFAALGRVGAMSDDPAALRESVDRLQSALGIVRDIGAHSHVVLGAPTHGGRRHSAGPGGEGSGAGLEGVGGVAGRRASIHMSQSIADEHAKENDNLPRLHVPTTALEAYLSAELGHLFIRFDSVSKGAADARSRRRSGHQPPAGAGADDGDEDTVGDDDDDDDGDDEVEGCAEAVPLLRAAAEYHACAVEAGDVDTLWGRGRARGREASILFAAAADASVAAGDLETARALLERSAIVDAEVYADVGVSTRGTKSWARVGNAHLHAAEDAAEALRRPVEGDAAVDEGGARADARPVDIAAVESDAVQSLQLAEARRHAAGAISALRVAEAVMLRRFGAGHDKLKLVHRRLGEAKALQRELSPPAPKLTHKGKRKGKGKKTKGKGQGKGSVGAEAMITHTRAQDVGGGDAGGTEPEAAETAGWGHVGGDGGGGGGGGGDADSDDSDADPTGNEAWLM